MLNISVHVVNGSTFEHSTNIEHPGVLLYELLSFQQVVSGSSLQHSIFESLDYYPPNNKVLIVSGQGAPPGKDSLASIFLTF